MIKKFESYNDFSQDDFNEMISDSLRKLNNSTPKILKLIFLNGGKLDKNKDYYEFILMPNTTSRLKLDILEVLTKYGGIDINKKFYWNGLYPSVTLLTIITRTRYKKPLFSEKHFYNLIIGIIKLGGDMTIKDFDNNSSYDYLNDKDIEYLNKYIKGFKKDYDFYMSSKNYNL